MHWRFIAIISIYYRLNPFPIVQIGTKFCHYGPQYVFDLRLFDHILVDVSSGMPSYDVLAARKNL